MSDKLTRDYSEEKVQLHRYDSAGNVIGDLYPITKGDVVLLEDEEFFRDTILENNLKNLYNYKIDTVKYEQFDEGTLITFFAQGLAVDVIDENDVVRNSILIPGKRANGEIYVVQTLQERDTLQNKKKLLGMLCYVIQTKKTYQLIDIQNNTWKSLSGSGVISVQTIQDRNNLTDDDKEIGVLCYVIDEQKTYQLINVDQNIWKKVSGIGVVPVQTIADRDAISETDKEVGLLCYVATEKKTYQLVNVAQNIWKKLGGSGILHVDDINERNNISDSDRELGMLCYVANDNMTYQLIGGLTNDKWVKFKASSFHIGNEAPQDRDLLWIDSEDEEINDDLIQSDKFDEIRHVLENMSEQIRDINYILNYKLDSGYFLDREPSWDGEIKKNPLKTYNDNPYSGNIKALTLKRGNKVDFLKPELTLMEGELAFCLDTEELYIGNKGTKRLLGKVGGGSGGGGNVTGEYIMLETPDRQYYRIYLDNSGKVHVMHGDAYFATAPEQSDSARFKGLLINHVFGGGALKKNVSPVTHSFIELYNNTDVKMNLKGLSLQVAGNDEKWETLELVGLVNPRSSFLIRCSEITNKDTAYPRLIIDDYDQDWEIEIDSIGYKVYLTVGLAPTEYANPANINGNGAKAEGYIDLLGVGGDKNQPIDGYEHAYLNVANNYTSVHRIDFADTGNNLLDCAAINWKEADTEIYRPRCSKDGKWDIHYDKIKLETFKPMLINVGFGQDGNTTRTFTWQTVRTKFGYVKYRKIGDKHFKFVESKKQLIVHGDIDATGHSVIIRNLTPGEYEYMVGEEGRWSDLYSFKVQVPKNTDTIKFLQVSDQQGFTEYEYLPWKYANDYIQNNETYDFIINTGDISQNANKSYEWRYYYEFAKYNVSNNMHMTCCGNNDLINKKDPHAFTYYSTYENSPLPSVCSWDYGYIHFICLNSNIDYGFTPIDDQLTWFEKDIAEINKRAVKPRWIIVYMHEAPYTIIRKKSYEKFHTAFAKAGVDLVLCGHHHMYSRSHGMGPFGADKSDNVLSWGDRYEKDQILIDPSKRVLRNGGVVYIMSQGTGSKLQGKTEPAKDVDAVWRGNSFRDSDPSYVMFTITYNEIQMNAYKIINILPLETIYPDPPKKVERDNLRIVKKGVTR